MSGVQQTVTSGVSGVPLALKALGTKVTRERRAVTANRSRLALTGRPGTGKSTLVNSNPKALILDLEGAGMTIRDPQALRFPSDMASLKHPADDIRKCFQVLVDNAGKPDMPETIVIDTLDELYDAFRRDLLQKHNLEDVGDYKGGHGKGYFVLRDEIIGWLDKLYRAGYGWCVICHIRPQTTADGAIIPTLAVPPSVAGVIYQKCEHFLQVELTSYANVTKTIKTSEGTKEVAVQKKLDKPQRYLSAASGRHARSDVYDDVKARLNFPDQILLPPTGGWAEFEKAFDEAVQNRLTNREAA